MHTDGCLSKEFQRKGARGHVLRFLIQKVKGSFAEAIYKLHQWLPRGVEWPLAEGVLEHPQNEGQYPEVFGLQNHTS